MVFLFPYMARWNSANMSRYGHLFRKIADDGHTVIVTQPPPRASEETNYIDLSMQGHPNILVVTVNIPAWMWQPKLPADKFFKKALYTVASVRTLRRLVREHEPDILVLYNLPQYLYTLFIRKPVVFDYADDYIAMLKHELKVGKSHLFVWLGEAILQRLIRRSVLITCVSHVLVEKVHHRNVVLLANGAEDLTADTFSGAEREINPGPVVGYVGAFEYFIDIPLMLQTAERMKHCTFLFVGAGRDYAWTKDEITRRGLQNVRLTGAVPHEQAMRYVAQMDICLNLFTDGEVTEGASPIKVFEYLAARRPVISSPIPALKLIDPEGDALFYAKTVDDVTINADAILADSALRARHVTKGAEIVKSGYTWTTLARRFVSEIQRSLSAAGYDNAGLHRELTQEHTEHR